MRKENQSGKDRSYEIGDGENAKCLAEEIVDRRPPTKKAIIMRQTFDYPFATGNYPPSSPRTKTTLFQFISFLC